MLNKTFVIVVVWIGPLPKSFPIWLRSMQNQPFDIVFFCDQDKPQYCHYEWNHVDLESLKNKFSEVIGFNVTLKNSYKICDYRPAFGEIFHDAISKYDYWGYCDLDLIAGNCSSFLSNFLLDFPDKIFQRGHLSFFKNTPEINSLYKRGNKIDYKYIFTQEKYCMFDEWHGIGKILKETNKLVAHEEVIVDIRPNSIYFESSNVKNYPIQLFTFCNGRVFQNYVVGNTIEKKEFGYIHFQKRKIDFSGYNDSMPLHIITSTKVISREDENLTIADLKKYNVPNYHHFINRTIDRVKIKLHFKEDKFNQYVMHLKD